MKLAKGLMFPDADEFMVGETSVKGQYQIAHLAAALRYVTDFSCAVDGGAHIGTWSTAMATRFARVLAFEPSPDTFACLDWNLTQAGATNVDRHACALGASAGRVQMALDDANAARRNTGARYAVAGGAIPVIALDSLALPSLGLLKLDVEGSEPLVLKGARETLLRCRPIVLFEDKKLWTRHFGMPKDAVVARLRSLGYRHLQRISCDEIWGPA